MYRNKTLQLVSTIPYKSMTLKVKTNFQTVRSLKPNNSTVRLL